MLKAEENPESYKHLKNWMQNARNMNPFNTKLNEVDSGFILHNNLLERDHIMKILSVVTESYSLQNLIPNRMDM